MLVSMGIINVVTTKLTVHQDQTTQHLMAAVGINGVAVARRVTPAEVILLAAKRYRSRYPSGRANFPHYKTN